MERIAIRMRKSDILVLVISSSNYKFFLIIGKNLPDSFTLAEMEDGLPACFQVFDEKVLISGE